MSKRVEYWLIVLVLFVLTLALFVLDLHVNKADRDSENTEETRPLVPLMPEDCRSMCSDQCNQWRESQSVDKAR